jgi:hypothetical protein
MVNSVLYSKKYDYAVSICAKSGCCTARNLFLQIHRDELYEEPEKGIHNLHIYYPLTKNINDIYNIVIVRNPFTRVVSMFVDKYINNGPIMKSIISRGIEIKKNSFMYFLQVLKHLKNLNILDTTEGHITSQSYNYSYNNKTIIVKLENFNKDILNAYENIFSNNKNQISKKVDDILNGPHKRLNGTVYDKMLTENVSHKDFLEKKNIPSYQYFYNDAAKKLVLEIYEKDFEYFGYSKDL